MRNRLLLAAVGFAAACGLAYAQPIWGPEPSGTAPKHPPVLTGAVVQASPNSSPIPAGRTVPFAVDSFGRLMTTLTGGTSISGNVTLQPGTQAANVTLPAASPLPVAGMAAHGASVSGNPVLTGGYAHPAGSPLPSAVSAGQAVRELRDVYGRSLNLLTNTAGSVVDFLLADLDSNGSTNITNGAAVGLLVPGAGGPTTVNGDSNGNLYATIRTGTTSIGGGAGGLFFQGSLAHDAAISSQNPVRIAGRARTNLSFYNAVASDDVADLITTLRGLLRISDDASADTVGTLRYCDPAHAGGVSEVVFRNSACNLYDMHISNPNTSDVFLLLFDNSNPTPGTTSPALSICIPGGSGASNRGVYDLVLPHPIQFNTACSGTIVTAANGSTAPAAACDINLGLYY